MAEVLVEKEVQCYHCGEPCQNDHIKLDDKDFCCPGCKAVFELFRDTDLEDIYKETNRVRPQEDDRYDYLDNDEIGQKLLDFQSEDHNSIRVKLPAIHCSSCIYLLENLHLFEKAIIRVSVNFVKQEADIHYDPQQLSLKGLANLLDTVGYAPQFEGLESKKSKSNTLSIKIGVAAFCFGNIMLLSFPEYLGFEEDVDASFKTFFSYLNLFLALPVVIYAASDYFVSAYKGLKNKFINIDVPIALGIVTLFGRSLYEVVSQTGPGYLDSLAGLVFFLLIGKWFQNKTYDNLSFERDYKSYFPLAATKIENGETVSVPIAELKEGDEVIVRNQEIIPADSVLLSDAANIDYSFVTGEEKPVERSNDDELFAGGRQVGQRIKVRIIKPSSQSYLTSLWNNQVFKEEGESGTEAITNQISKYFTFVVLFIALAAATYWYFADASNIWQVVTAVLIVACPCALALSAPFTNGNTLRVFGRNKFYLKNALGAEKLNNVTAIVFDKTGTLTENIGGSVKFCGYPLSNEEVSIVHKMTENSMHPLSKKIGNSLKSSTGNLELENFKEIAGSGLFAETAAGVFKLGSAAFIEANDTEVAGRVYLRIGGDVRGYFEVSNQFRSGLKELIQKLKGYKLAILSGDNDHEREQLAEFFPTDTEMHFKQQPQDKLEFVKSLQDKGYKVMMLGDGLNDAGALKQSNMGIAVTEDVSTFSPACDGILEGHQLPQLADYMAFAKSGRGVVITSFTISFLYNFVGLSFAVAGALTPIFAAVLMPLSSISVVGFTTLASNYLARKKQLL